jgi:hypothetical protein
VTSEQWIRDEIEKCDSGIEKIKDVIMKGNFKDSTHGYINAHYMGIHKERKQTFQEVLE